MYGDITDQTVVLLTIFCSQRIFDESFDLL